MQCHFCQSEIKDTCIFCPKCGEKCGTTLEQKLENKLMHKQEIGILVFFAINIIFIFCVVSKFFD